MYATLSLFFSLLFCSFLFFSFIFFLNSLFQAKVIEQKDIEMLRLRSHGLLILFNFLFESKCRMLKLLMNFQKTFGRLSELSDLNGFSSLSALCISSHFSRNWRLDESDQWKFLVCNQFKLGSSWSLQENEQHSATAPGTNAHSTTSKPWWMSMVYHGSVYGSGIMVVLW